jgi:hypothetical protein
MKLYKSEYNCPICGWKNKKDINYPDAEEWAKNADKKLLTSGWCIRCGATHKFLLSIKEKDEDSELKIHSFTCNDVVSDINLKLIIKEKK